MAQKAKSIEFAWEGVNRRGQKISGTLSGQNMAMVKAQLRKQGIQPEKVKRKAQPMFGLGGSSKKKIKTADITFFTRQMATMIKAGVPLVQSFEIVADGVDNLAMKKLILELRDNVAAGNDFASSLKQHPEHFDELTCNLVESGEQSGALETMLDKVAIYKEKSEALKSKLKKAMGYPITVLIVAAIVTAILLIKVVPTFQGMFESFGSELPAPTQFVIFLSDGLQKYWFMAVAVIAGLVFAYKTAIKNSPKFRDQMDLIFLKFPVFGPILHKAAVARFARVLSTTFAAGVPLVEALQSVAGAVGNKLYRDAVLSVRQEVSNGQQMHFAMRATNVFPNMVIQMTSIGEESGALDAMLDKAASYYETEVDESVDGLTAMMEPMIMAFLGVVVGGLVISMYLPIFQIGNAL
ncbi:type II secretion system F family protein [Oceanobacter mangrovi]|uniref:type II secretion system F family protein n=1 Tax=Oceanobacter mangrovi TaxID=2862510 RepID=UPI001C8D778C|nr:type II secretion system F family protein [Oceanobacter mangrovi]